MKKAMCLVVMLAMVATASATVRVIVTSSASGYGLENNANAFTPTVSTVFTNGVSLNGYDYEDYYGNPGPLRPGTFPTLDEPAGTPGSPIGVDASVGDFAYVWLQFQNEPKGAKINGLVVSIFDTGTTTPAAGLSYAWYLCNNLQNQFVFKRWDGTATPPSYPEFINNPQTFIAITALGLVNGANSNDANLYDGTTRYALLGAIAGPASDQVYDIAITNISYASPPNPEVSGGSFQFTPEPASLLLMGLAGLLLRRR
jgi:hypothetical protein